MFTFTTSTTKPRARVRCHDCDWEATGNDPRRVFPRADEHACQGDSTAHTTRIAPTGGLETHGEAPEPPAAAQTDPNPTKDPS